MTATVFITTSFEGYHCWPDAPNSVGFLRDLHRHLFGVRVEVRVSHGDREVEFFTLKNEVDEYIKYTLKVKLAGEKSMSCEMMALELDEYLRAKYAVVSIEVNEDGENGAIIRP